MLRQQKKTRGRVAGVSPFRRSASSLNQDQLLGLTNEYMTTCDWKIPSKEIIIKYFFTLIYKNFQEHLID